MRAPWEIGIRPSEITPEPVWRSRRGWLRQAVLGSLALGVGGLARAGADVVVNDRERTAGAEAVVAEIQALGRAAALVEGDVFDQQPRAERAFGKYQLGQMRRQGSTGG